MKIKLISPKMSLRPMDSNFKRIMAPSLGLLVLGSLTPSQHSIEFEDENVEKINFNDKPDLIGITVNVDTSKQAYKIASRYRQKNIQVVLGGIHASANHEEALLYGDSVCIGEAEELWENILLDAKIHRLKRTYFNNNPTNVSKIPLPRWDLVNSSKYLYTNIMCATRGCPFKCEFCYNSCLYVHNEYRNRPIENILEEIDKMGTKQVMFIDDNFIGNINYTKRLVKAIKPLGLKWHAAVSANIGNHLNLLDEMQYSGCKSLFIGFESINEDSIRSVNKHQNNIDEYDRTVQDIHSRDIMVNASMVFGLDHDYPSVFNDTLKWLIQNKIETITAHILTPYPGTKLFQRLESEGRIVDYNWCHYNTSHVVYEPKHMSREELYSGYIRLYKRFYSFKNIIRRIPESKKQRIPYLLFNLGYRKFGNVTSRIASYGYMSSLGRLARRLSYGIG